MSLMHLNNQLSAATEVMDSMPAAKTLVLMGHSVLLGIVLMFIAIWATRKLRNNDPAKEIALGDIVLSAGNYLFLAIGMTVVMILVNNNLARAFAIGAAISLVRLRIKVDGKGQGTNLLIAVLVGMACGVDQVVMAWGLMAIYTLLQASIIGSVTYFSKTQVNKPAPESPSVAPAKGLVSLKPDAVQPIR